MAVLQDLTAETMLEMIAKLQAENVKLKLNRNGNGIKVSAKGAVSVYGLGRFPVTLYKTQWLKLLAMTGQIETFIADHNDELSVKED